MAEGSYFRGKHEIKFGLLVAQGHGGLDVGALEQPGHQHRDATTSATRTSDGDVVSPWASANRRVLPVGLWIGDTISLSRTTITAGLRFDCQNDGLLAHRASRRSPGFERGCRPSTGDVPKVITWNSVSPRVSITYALDESRKTQLRASYAMFASQLGNGASGIVGVVHLPLRLLLRDATRTATRSSDIGEFDSTPDIARLGRVQPHQPGRSRSSTRSATTACRRRTK